MLNRFSILAILKTDYVCNAMQFLVYIGITKKMNEDDFREIRHFVGDAEKISVRYSSKYCRNAKIHCGEKYLYICNRQLYGRGVISEVKHYLSVY